MQIAHFSYINSSTCNSAMYTASEELTCEERRLVALLHYFTTPLRLNWTES